MKFVPLLLQTVLGAWLVILVGQAEATAGAEGLAVKKAAREAMLGPVIARTASYAVYAPKGSTVTKGGVPVCRVGMTAEQRNADYQKVEDKNQGAFAEYRANQKAFLEYQSRRYQELMQQRGKISAAEYKQRYNALRRQLAAEKKEKVDDPYARATESLEQEKQALKDTVGDGNFTLIFLHTPAGPNTPILPFERDQQYFIDELNANLAGFLKTCGGIYSVFTQHYYRDVYGYNEAKGGVANFRYAVKNGSLSKWGHGGWDVDLARSPELTQAGLIRINQEQERQAATYRQAFEQASGRQHGIVYKLDPYWAQYQDFDVARRIFDGDFADYSNAVSFKAFFHALASAYSKKCKDHVTEWKTYERLSTDYDHTTYNLDGSKTIHKTEHVKTRKVDKRFTPQWARYDTELAQAAIENGMIASLGRILSYGDQMAAFMNKHACNSATVSQMTENFIRAANSRRSAQADGMRFPGAITESDRPTR